ncbi:MAG TPA: hypothetical protein VMS30_00850 [Phycisphaerales bacterium]|jgi:hypothetical protein|nr:hypothetical protein [Phycisphaerales bacterium]
MTNRFRSNIVRVLPFIVVALAALGLGGCNAYMIQGKVVRGESSGVELVYVGDERLDLPGVPGAEVRIVREPTNPNRHLVGQAHSSPSGEITVIMDEFGTGWMEETWLVQSQAGGFQNAEEMMQLPSKGTKWRLLITLGPGVSEPFREDDLMQDLEKFK